MNILGSLINGYTFIEILGGGSFGAVYKASKGDQEYAVKILSETYVLDEFKNDDNRITREIDILKVAKNESLVEYVDDFFFMDEFNTKQYALVMEYFQGITLSSFLETENNLDVLEQVFIKVLVGVKALHETIIGSEGIIHRDLKPDNIMIDKLFNVKIIDYGLSKIIDFSSITSTGANIGSPLYMSPEQINDSKHIDYRSDIYALGVILYKMTTKNVPYEAKTVPELIMKILNDPIIPPKQYNSGITDGLEKIIFKATAKELFARFQTVDEFIKAFTYKEIDEEITTIPTYYAWIYREKDVTERFEKVNNTNIIYPIHVKDWMKGLHAHFCEKLFDNVIIDPSTQRLSYLAFGKTAGLRTLLYAPKDGVISLDYLRNPQQRAAYINNWYSTVSMGSKLVLPYHYISNTDYPVDKIDDWIKMNIQLIDESAKIVGSDKEKHAMISIGLNQLVFESKKILSYFVHADVDGFIVQVSDMKNLNDQSISSYIDFIVNLQKYTNKPVVALKVPIALGLFLVSKGIHGFSLGLASIDYFDEEYIKSEKDAFNLYSKYYFPQLLSFLSYPKKDIFAFESIYKHFGDCKCRWCDGKTAIEIGSGDKGVQLHHWEKMLDEVELIKQYNISQKDAYMEERIDNAINEFDSIPRDIMGSQKSNDYYKLLKLLKNTY